MLGLAAAGALAVSGCGGSGGHVGIATTTLAAPGQGTTTSTTAASTPTDATSTTAPAPVGGGGSAGGSGSGAGAATSTTSKIGCSAGELTASWPAGGTNEGSTYYYSVTLHNDGPSPCETGGYVGVSAYNLGGQLIASTDTHQPGPTPTLTVAPGGSVAFTVGFVGDGKADGGAACGGQRVGSLHLIPPNETSSDQVATQAGGSYPAMCGTALYVQPLHTA